MAATNNTTTWTEARRQELSAAGKVIRYRTQTSAGDYNKLMFEIGSEFARQFAKQYPHVPGLLENLLTNTDYGFWSWFKVKWAMDDYALISTDCVGEFEYPDMKRTIIGDPLFEKDLHYTICDRL